MTAIYNITPQDVKNIRSICKKHGIKGCRKNTSKTKPSVYVGSQIVRIEKETAKAFLSDLNENGYGVYGVTDELADKGLFTSTNVYKTKP